MRVNFIVLEQRLVGERHLKLVLDQGDGIPLDAIAFNIDLEQWPSPAVSRVHLAYRMDSNFFRGQTSLQLMIEWLQPIVSDAAL